MFLSSAALLVNPIEILKIRMQTSKIRYIFIACHVNMYNIVGGLTGYQHIHRSNLAAAWNLAKVEGIKGLYKGLGMSVLRGILGPGTQISSYHKMKEQATIWGWDVSNPFVNAFISAFSAGVSVIGCNPADVIRTRLYNQPFDKNGNPLYYKNGIDAFIKITKTEGFSAFYKGGYSHFLRIGPHLVLVFFFLEQLKMLHLKFSIE